MSDYENLVAAWTAVYRERLEGSDVSDERIRKMAESAALRNDSPPPLRKPGVSIDFASVREQAEETFELSYLDEFWIYKGLGAIKRKVVPVVKTWLKDLWLDPAKFVGVCRWAVVSLAAAILTGKVVFPAPYEAWAWALAPWIAGAAVGIPAGRKNPTPEEIKAIAHDPEIVPAPKV